MRWSSELQEPYPLDIGLIAPNDGLIPEVGPGTQRRLSFGVVVGGTYVIEIWSFLDPGEEFELTTALLAN
jgi:hypothetical protein